MEELLQSFLSDFKAPSNEKDLRSPKNFFGSDGFQNLYQYLIKNQMEMPAALKGISEMLGEMDLLKACCAGHFCGSLIDQVGVGEAGIPLVDLFVKVVSASCGFLTRAEELLGLEQGALEAEQVERADLAKLFEDCSDGARAYYGCDLLTLAVMAAITRDAASRIRLRGYEIYRQLKYLEGFVDNVSYVVRVRDSCIKMPLFPLLGYQFYFKMPQRTEHLF